MEGDILCPKSLQGEPGQMHAGIIWNHMTNACVCVFLFTSKCFSVAGCMKAIIIFTPIVFPRLTQG